MKKITLVLTILFLIGINPSVSAFDLVDAETYHGDSYNVLGYEYGLDYGVLYTGSVGWSTFYGLTIQNNVNPQISMQLSLGDFKQVTSNDGYFRESKAIWGKYKYFYTTKPGQRYYVTAIAGTFDSINVGGGTGLEFEIFGSDMTALSEIAYLHSNHYLFTSGVKIHF